MTSSLLQWCMQIASVLTSMHMFSLTLIHFTQHNRRQLQEIPILPRGKVIICNLNPDSGK